MHQGKRSKKHRSSSQSKNLPQDVAVVGKGSDVSTLPESRDRRKYNF